MQWAERMRSGSCFNNIKPAELDEIERLIDEYEEGDGHAYA